jgi:hypothetical protein
MHPWSIANTQVIDSVRPRTVNDVSFDSEVRAAVTISVTVLGAPHAG